MGTDEVKWLQPMIIDEVTLAFPIFIKKYMPAKDEIPKDYRGRAKWEKFQRDWFSRGFDKLDLSPKDGINTYVAITHLSMIQKSYEPKHEHKAAAVAYLASLWFEDVLYKVKKEEA